MEAKDEYWKINKKWFKIIAGMISCFLLIVLFLMPQSEIINDNIRVAQLYIMLSDAKKSVEEQLINNKHPIKLSAADAIPKTFGILPKNGNKVELSYKEITTEGEIRVFSPQLGIMMVLTPTLTNGKVIWSCWGSPKSNMPRSCR